MVLDMQLNSFRMFSLFDVLNHHPPPSLTVVKLLQTVTNGLFSALKIKINILYMHLSNMSSWFLLSNFALESEARRFISHRRVSQAFISIHFDVSG